MQESHYQALAAMAALSFVSMYILMYAMVDRFADVYANVNQAYMAMLMTAPMVVIELMMMGRMYSSKRINRAITFAAGGALALSFFAVRNQTGVTDRQFLRSMIPHHAAAVLMCERAPVENADIKRLCESIVSSQKAEISQMRKLLDER